jgi:uncharacterized protein
MRYGEEDRESDNVEDRRSEPGSVIGGRSGISFPIPLGGGGMSLTTLLIIGGVCLLLGINPLTLLGSGDVPGLPNFPRTEPHTHGSPFEIPRMPAGSQRIPAQNDEMTHFVRRVLADTEDVWERVFQAAGRTYEKPTLVLFTRSTRTACGTGMAAMGPFYCPLDRKVYIDLAFYDELKTKFHAPGDFAQAYVVAHEVGHHVQTLLGVADKVQALKSRADEEHANALQVRLELQADCLAGVWASLNDQVKKRLQPGDVEAGLNAAAQIGDDTLQRRTRGYVVPEAFTHGTSVQRVKWFRKGLDAGQLQQCDTFGAPEL